MADIFKQKNFLLIATTGIAFLLSVCPGAHAQQPADGSPQTAQSGSKPQDPSQTATQSVGGTSQTTQAPPPKAKPAPKPKKKKIQSTPVKKKKAPAPAKQATEEASAEPDKILYERAQKYLKSGRYTEGRLVLQTLINSYPDSEYLAKAKLAEADSYYKEGGTSSTMQAIQAYKDFITFFPFLDEAAYAQMQVGMSHYHMMEKSDRDNTQAQQAEDEFQAFILKYPQSPLVPKAEQYLRDVQETLADGEYRIAHYYYTKMDYRAAAARLVEVSDRYPLYSQTDDALWMLGSIYARAKQASKNEDDKNHWGDLAAKCYDRILQDYPLSSRSVDAKARLQSMGLPVPKANPDSLARMQKDQLYEKQHHQSVALKLPLNMIKGSPDVSMASHTGQPQLNPPNDAISATDVLRPGAQGPSFTISGTAAAGSSPDAGSGAVPVDAVPTSSAPTGAAGNSMGMQIITAPNDSSAPPTEAAPNPAPSSDTATSPPPNSVPVLAPTPAESKNATSDPGTAATPAPSTDPPATGAPVSSSGGGTEPISSAPQGGSTVSPADAGKAPSTNATQAAPNDPKTESTSKKKKGIKKLIPW